jgi:hypothetical protein
LLLLLCIYVVLVGSTAVLPESTVANLLELSHLRRVLCGVRCSVMVVDT